MPEANAGSGWLTTVLRRPKAWSVASQIAYVVSAGVLNVVVVRVWGPEERGFLATVTVVSTLAATIGGLGLTDVLVWAKGPDGPTEGVSARFRRSLVGCGVVGTASGLATSFFLDDWVGMLVLPSTLAIHLFRASMSTRLAAGDFARFSFERVALPVFTALAVAVGAVSAVGSPVALALLGQALATALLFDRRASDLQLQARPRSDTVTERRVARESVIGNLAGTSLARLDVVIVATIVSATDVGRYAVVLAVGDGAMVAAFGLMFHAMHEGATEQRANRRTLGLAVLSTMILSALGILGLHLAAVPVLGDGFNDIELTFALLTPGLVAMSYLRLRYAGDLTSGRGRRATSALISATGLMLLLDLALVPRYGIDGAAVGSTVAYVVAAGMVAREPRA